MNKTIEKITITPSQEANLVALADYLSKPEEMEQEFLDGRYCEGKTNFEWAGDGLAHGPNIGIPRLSNQETWGEYAERVFGLKEGSDEYLWCFGDLWWDDDAVAIVDYMHELGYEYCACGIDRTPEGTASRINFLLTKGLPFNSDRQMNGVDMTCYERMIEHRDGYVGELNNPYIAIVKQVEVKKYKLGKPIDPEGYVKVGNEI